MNNLHQYYELTKSINFNLIKQMNIIYHLNQKTLIKINS